jgi:hypothetical protein|tara:strand:- start:219 stop:668 length:450 start_codon:yes stop_codon:yes gene_type:complete
MAKDEIQSLYDILVSDDRLIDNNNKIKMKDLHLCFKYGNVKTELQNEVVAKLQSDGFITIAKGDSTHTPLQRKVVRYFNHQFHKDLMETRKTSFSITEEEANELKEAPEGIGFNNALGDFIVPKVNNDNITHKRQVKKAKAQMEQLKKS